MAPEGTMVNELPEQIDPLFTVTTGRGTTVTLESAGEETQPWESVPLTVYVVLEEGITVAVPPEKEYERAPAGIMANAWPVHMEPLFTVTKGKAITLTFEIAVFEETQPWALVPVTE